MTSDGMESPAPPPQPPESTPPSQPPGTKTPAQVRRRIFGAFAVSGTLLLATSIAALVANPNQVFFDGLAILALFLLFLAAVVIIQNEHPLVQGLAYAGFGLCLIAAVTAGSVIAREQVTAKPITDCSLFTIPTAPPTPTPTDVGSAGTGESEPPTPKPLPKTTPTPMTGVQIASTAPQQMDINGSEYIGVTMRHRTLRRPSGKHGQSGTTTVTVHQTTCSPGAQRVGGKVRLVATPLDVGTPGVPVELTFGKKYANQVSASAMLEAVKFDATPNNADWQSLAQPKDDWGWTITPKAAGQQVVLLDINMLWQVASGSRHPLPPIQRTVWESGPIYIDVKEPLISAGQFNVSVLLGGVIATGLTALTTALIARFLPAIQGRKE